MLRLRIWRHVFGQCTYRLRPGFYKNSSEWQQYLYVLREDARRCNSGAAINHDVEHLLCSYASEHRSDGYWQGFLYVAYPIVHVLPQSEQLSALMLVIGGLRVYGPHGHQHGFADERYNAAREVVKGVRRAQKWLSHPMFCTTLCYRWFFIFFGQMFVWQGNVPAYLLQVWDFLLHDVVAGTHARLRLFAHCAVVEYCKIAPCCDDVLEDFSHLFDFKWSDDSIVRILQNAYITARAKNL